MRETLDLGHSSVRVGHSPNPVEQVYSPHLASSVPKDWSRFSFQIVSQIKKKKVLVGLHLGK